MNHELWAKLSEYNFDDPMSEYGFSTRLANENFWTKDFTEKAIVEYKKFMYLAATSDLMVSPSEIIDVVWHQHLIFTQSYTEFCNIIGKTIQHVPSTHNKEEAEKFKLAKERTIRFYKENFGEQAKEIWEYSDMYESLELVKAKIKIRTFINLGVLAFIILIVPFYFLLRPVYVQFDNPYFIITYISIAVLTVFILEIYNRQYLSRISNNFKEFTFIRHLKPLELVYLKTQMLSDVIHGTMNQLVHENKILINHDHTISKTNMGRPNSLEQWQVMEELDYFKAVYYPTLMRSLLLKPVFWNTANCMNALKKYFIKSKTFGLLFYLNFGILAILLMLGFIRFSTGLIRDKPVTQLFFVLVFSVVIIIAYLWRLTKMFCTISIPELYKNEILPSRRDANDWEWRYFLTGPAVLAASFLPMVNYVNKNDKNSAGGGCGSSGGSSCGSSCSGCGGCGGGD